MRGRRGGAERHGSRRALAEAPEKLRSAASSVLNARQKLHEAERRLRQELRERNIEISSAEAIEFLREGSLAEQLEFQNVIERARTALVTHDGDEKVHPRLHALIDRIERRSRGLVGPDWKRLTDGRVWRVRQGRDFPVSIHDFCDAAREAASLVGKQALFVRDKTNPDEYVWVQFLDGVVTLGEPCPCGGTSFTRIRAGILRCNSCRSRLVAKPRPSPRRQRRRPPHEVDRERVLSPTCSVRLRLIDATMDERRYAGVTSETSGEESFVVLRVPLVEGSPVPDEKSRLGYVHEVLEERPGVGQDAASGDWDVVVA